MYWRASIQFNSIHHILFAGPLGVILLKVTSKDMTITDSRDTPTKVQSVPLAWEPPGNRIQVKLHTSS